MADLTCVVCGEPWDAWGVRHGDMKRWEASLFLKGAGCPCCQGRAEPEPGPMELLAGQESVADRQLSFLQDRILLNPDEDCAGELLENALSGNRPEWVQPKPKELWRCAGCDVSVIRDPDTDYPDGRVDGVGGGDLAWHGGQSVHYSGGYGFHYGQLSSHEEPSDESYATVVEEDYCPGCVELCGECRQTFIFTRDDLFGDTYDDGASFLSDGKSVCIHCVENEGEE